ncbi:MAG: IS3 family transposase, partial [Acidobacteriota bacterium]
MRSNWIGLKKRWSLSAAEKRQLITPDDPTFSIRQQCSLVQLNRSTYYYEAASEDLAADKVLMGLIDEIYTEFPEYGSPRMTAALKRLGQDINHKKVERLMQEMGLKAHYPGPNTSKRNKEHQLFPYLLRGVTASHPNHIWGTDITYIRLLKGFAYLVAIL